MEKTGQERMQFIGFGMGVTAFVVTMNELPEYADNVKMAHFMAPATYLRHVRTPLAQMGGRFVRQLEVRARFFVHSSVPSVPTQPPTAGASRPRGDGRVAAEPVATATMPPVLLAAHLFGLPHCWR